MKLKHKGSIQGELKAHAHPFLNWVLQRLLVIRHLLQYFNTSVQLAPSKDARRLNLASIMAFHYNKFLLPNMEWPLQSCQKTNKFSSSHELTKW